MAHASATLEWVVPEPRKLAYRIQEAFASATALKIKPYDELRNKWRIKLRGNTVIAEFVFGPDAMPSSLQFSNITDPLDVIETIIRHKTVDFDLLFTSLQAEHVDDMIREYCLANGYVIQHEPLGMLIKRKSDEDASP